MVVGGGVSLVTTIAVEAFRNRAESTRQAVREQSLLATRWDQDLAHYTAELIASARRLRHIAGRLDRADDRPLMVRLLDEQHESLRSLAAQVGLLGSLDVQERARMVARHAYAVRAVGDGLGDPRASEYPDSNPDDRLVDAIADLQLAVRRQLRMPDADDVLNEAKFR